MRTLLPASFLITAGKAAKDLTYCAILLTLSASLIFSQELRPKGDIHGGFTSTDTRLGPEQTSPTSSSYTSPKRSGHYSPSDWRALIDSLWGPGPSTAAKLEIFDTFWSLIDRFYGGFPNLNLNWDSLKARYRPEIEAGVSRGRLWGILGHMYLSLQEIHTWIGDLDLDKYFMENDRLVYKPGIPAFFPSGWGWAGNFGAALTPLPDSSLLVYRAVSPHPLGIVGGDIILGYDRIPWKRLYRELLSIEFPLEWWSETRFGSSPRSMSHALLSSAGSNWGLFDTIDVVKYATGDTVHLPTAPLYGLDWLSLFATEQLPIPGVRMPNYAGGEQISWGVVNNSSIGYIYVYSWDEAVGPLFAAAMNELINVNKVVGLILDFRYNRGSVNSNTSPNRGLDYLFNEDPANQLRWQAASRSDIANRFAFHYGPPPASFQAGPEYFDRPIAVLTGPQPWSIGDHTAFRMRFHPMVRSFGLPTNGAFVYGIAEAGPRWGAWYYSLATGQMQSQVNNEGFLMHKSFPVDEEIWLTRDGVAKGEDDVVKRALDWIRTLSYAHDVQLSQTSRDTIGVTARVENPLAHSLRIGVVLQDALGTFRDSLVLKDDGLHGDDAAGDNLWGIIYVPPDDATIHAAIRTDDLTTGTSRNLPNAATLVFTRGAIITMDTRTVDLGRVSMTTPYYDAPFTVRNIGYAPDSLTVSLDPGNVAPDTAVSVLPTAFMLAPGDSQKVTFRLRPSLLSPQYYSVQVTVQSKSAFGQNRLEKSFQFQVVISSVSGNAELPTEFVLSQNYPNPFNPTTTLSYQLPIAGMIRLTMYDALGREVAVLVNESKEPGTHQVTFDATHLASGVYLCRMTAGAFVDTKKVILLR